MDPKPLIPLFSTKHLEELPVRVQRFILWMLRFDFNIVYVPGKNLVIARVPLIALDQHNTHFKDDVQAYVDVIVQYLPAMKRRLEEI